ncbi:MAG TPA: antitoxin Xre/MbcA/ParS toxin-binding domain-containing protein [Alphaproteobacteria bacterium]|jgi:putative toxin-antitoxin system antitoxin component (TIGR02293 family)
MTDLLEAARVLGVGGTRRLSSPAQYLALLHQGLPVKSLERIANAIAPSDARFKYRIVSKATVARLKLKRKLSANQSVLVARLAGIWARALKVWGSPEEARDFLYRPHPLLDGRPPIDLVFENEVGAQLVDDILGRLEHGSAA